MVYNLYECALPHGYGLVGGDPTNLRRRLGLRVFLDACKRLSRKVFGPIMYRTMIVCYGYMFSYMNVLYTQHTDTIQMEAVVQEISQPVNQSLEKSTPVLFTPESFSSQIMAHQECTESRLCFEQSLICT